MMTTGLCTFIFMAATTITVTEAQIKSDMPGIEQTCAKTAVIACSPKMSDHGLALTNTTKIADYCKATIAYLECLKSNRGDCAVVDNLIKLAEKSCQTFCTCGTTGLAMSFVVVLVTMVLVRMTGI